MSRWYMYSGYALELNKDKPPYAFRRPFFIFLFLFRAHDGAGNLFHFRSPFARLLCSVASFTIEKKKKRQKGDGYRRVLSDKEKYCVANMQFSTPSSHSFVSLYYQQFASSSTDLSSTLYANEGSLRLCELRASRH